MDLQIKECDIAQPPWQLNTSLLSNDDFVTFISWKTDFFMDVNKTPETSA